MEKNNILQRHSEQVELKYTNETEQTSVLVVFCFSHAVMDKSGVYGVVRGTERAEKRKHLLITSFHFHL